MLENQNIPSNHHFISNSPQISHHPIVNPTPVNQVHTTNIKFQNSATTTTPQYFPKESSSINRLSNQSSQPLLYRTQNYPTTTRNSNSNSFSFPVPVNVSFTKKNNFEVNQTQQKKLASIQIKPTQKNLYPTPNAASVYVSPLKSNKPSEHIFQKPLPVPTMPTKSIEQFKIQPERPKINSNSKQKSQMPVSVNFNSKQKGQLGSVSQRNYIKPQVNFSNAHNLNTSTSISTQNQFSARNIHQTPKFFNNVGFSVSNSDFHPSSIKSFENIQLQDSNKNISKSSFSHSKELQIPLIIQNMKNQFDAIKSGNHQQEQKFKLSTDIAESLNLNSPSPINLQKSNKKQSPQEPNSIPEPIQEDSKQNYRQFITTPTSNMFNTIVELSESANSVADQEREYVVQQYQNGSRYVGYKSNNMRNGKGKFYYQEGSFYDGEWKNNNMHGFGMLYYSNNKLAYEGQWYMDQFHGKGKVYNDEPQKLDGPFDYTNFQNLDQQWNYYEGTLVSDSKQGYGTLVLSNGQKYEGGFQNDNVHGRGKFYTISGQIIDGYWKNSILERRL